MSKMKEEYKDKTKEQLINDLVGLRQRIAELEKAEEERNKLLKAIDTTKEAINITTPDSVMIYTNDAMNELFGYKKGELIGKHVSILNAGSAQEAKEVPKQIVDTIKKKGVWEGEIHNKRKDGTEFTCIARITALTDKNGKIINYVSTQHDITKRKQAEAEREQLIKELDAKTTEMRRFTYTVSHDLRAPLVTIQGFAEVLRKDLEQNEIEKVESDLKYIESSATKMDRLLTDTLQLSRIGRMVNPPEDVPYGEIAQDALHLQQAAQQIKLNGVEISVAEDFPAVHVDRMRIVEVLVNLITNSINYMGEQPHPKIYIGYRIDGEENVFFVRDNGIRIDKSRAFLQGG